MEISKTKIKRVAKAICMLNYEQTYLSLLGKKVSKRYKQIHWRDCWNNIHPMGGREQYIALALAAIKAYENKK